MSELDKVLDKHLKIVEQKFKRIPKSNKHEGMLAEIQNKLESTKIFTKHAEKIVNEESEAMLNFINTKLIDDYPQDEVDKFTEKARKKFTEVIQKGINNSLK